MIQPIASRSLPDDDILFQEHGITVTPSWFELDNVSYATRYIRRLSLHHSEPPRQMALVILGVGLLLAMVCLVYWFRGLLPLTLNWLLLVACAGLILSSAYVAFMVPSTYRLDVHVDDDELVPVPVPTRDVLLRLEEALSLAVEANRQHVSATLGRGRQVSAESH